jgi:beta-galactosidase
VGPSNGTFGTVWADRVDVVDDSLEVLASYTSGEATGRPALTRRRTLRGSATYVSTRLHPDGIEPVL